MKRKILMTIWVMTCCMKTAGQGIKGFVMDEHQQPLVYVNVQAYSLPDSTRIGGACSNEDGGFAFDVPDGNYLLRASEIGYETLEQMVATGTDAVLVMKERLQHLGEATITAKRPQYKMVNGGISIDVKHSLLSQVGNALDVLRELPRVKVDANGGISVTAKGTPLIYINGRKMQDPKELNRLKSDEIKEVEIITNPGARYNASALSVIRILTDKVPGEGWSARTECNGKTNYEHFGGYGEGYAKYRHKGLEVFGSGLLNSSIFKESQYLCTDIAASEHIVMESKESLSASGVCNANGNVGFNYDFNSAHSLGANGSYSTVTSRDAVRADMFSNVYSNGALTDRLYSQMLKKDIPTTYNADAYYSGKVSKLKIDLNLSFMHTEEREESENFEQSQMAESRTMHTLSLSKGRLWAEKLVLEHPIWKGFLSVGNELTFSKTRGDYENREGVIKPSNTEITERNMAFFAQYAITWGHWNAMAGIRYEHVKSDCDVFGVRQEAQSRKYRNLFPSASLSWNRDGWGVQMAYSCKTKRPGYSRLSNNVQYDNRYLYEGGNPYLRPTISQNFDFSALHSWWSLSMGYCYSRKTFNYILGLYQDKAIGYGVFRNFNHTQHVYATLVLSPKLGCYRPQLEMSYTQQFIDGIAYGVTENQNRPSMSVDLKNRLEFKHDFNILVDLNCSTRMSDCLISQQGVFSANVQIIKSFMQRRLRLNLVAGDVLHTWRQKLNIYGNCVNIAKNCDCGTSQLSLTVTYWFNASKSRYKGTGAGDSEKHRM